MLRAYFNYEQDDSDQLFITAEIAINYSQQISTRYGCRPAFSRLLIISQVNVDRVHNPRAGEGCQQIPKYIEIAKQNLEQANVKLTLQIRNGLKQIMKWGS